MGGEVQVVIEEIGADDLAIREVIYIEEEDDVADDAPMVAQVEQEGEDEEIVFEDAVGQVGVEQVDEEGHLEEQADLAEVDPQDGPALSDTIDLTDSPRPNRMPLEPLQCPICLDPLRGLPTWKEVLSTPCGYLFCNTCLVTALRNTWQCPTCRRRTRAEEAIKIFL